MKLTLLSLLLAAAGMGTYGLCDKDTAAAATPATDDCRVEVECTPRGTCLVTCFEDDGSIRCQEELDCDEPCVTAQDCDEPCAPAGGCSK
jgi:hypothetical protein